MMTPEEIRMRCLELAHRLANGQTIPLELILQTAKTLERNVIHGFRDSDEQRGKRVA